jgi:hypothetical protein
MLGFTPWHLLSMDLSVGVCIILFHRPHSKDQSILLLCGFTAAGFECRTHVCSCLMIIYARNINPNPKPCNKSVFTHVLTLYRVPKIGYRVSWVKLDPSTQQPIAIGVLLDGFLSPDQSVSGRPVDVEQLPDGSLLVSDDFGAGGVWRITYAPPSATAGSTISNATFGSAVIGEDASTAPGVGTTTSVTTPAAPAGDGGTSVTGADVTGDSGVNSSATGGSGK